MSSFVLDASALLALLNQEPGEETVTDAVARGAVMSAVNLSEVVAKLGEVGLPEEVIREVVDPLGLEIVPFDAELGYHTAQLRPHTKSLGLSLGDRACLALGKQRGLAVLTADRSWMTLAIGLTIEVIC